MANTILDLLDKFISIEENGCSLFLNLSSQEDIPIKVKTMAKVFAQEEKRHIGLYQKLKGSIETPDIEIDSSLYQKADRLIYDLKRINNPGEIKSLKELLEFCLNFERENLILVLEIQNLMKIDNPIESVAYKILTDIAYEEQKHVANIESCIN